MSSSSVVCMLLIHLSIRMICYSLLLLLTMNHTNLRWYGRQRPTNSCLTHTHTIISRFTIYSTLRNVLSWMEVSSTIVSTWSSLVVNVVEHLVTHIPFALLCCSHSRRTLWNRSNYAFIINSNFLTYWSIFHLLNLIISALSHHILSTLID